MTHAIPSDESTVDVNEDPVLQAPSQLVTIVICVDKTCDSDRRDQQIWHVKRQLVLVIWVMILLVLDFVEVSTVALHDWIKNKFVSVLVI